MTAVAGEVVVVAGAVVADEGKPVVEVVEGIDVVDGGKGLPGFSGFPFLAPGGSSCRPGCEAAKKPALPELAPAR